MFYPNEKGGGSFSHIEWGAKSFHSLKGGTQKVLPCLEGGGTKSFVPAIFQFCSPPPPCN